MAFKREIPYDDLPLLWPDQGLWKKIEVLEKLNRANKATKEVLCYGIALTESYKQLHQADALSVPFIENIYRIIKEAKDGVRDTSVRIGNDFETRYTPPAEKAVVLQKLDNWVQKAKEDSAIDPLIRMAILHYQFEAIHPFRDGNGRTGRVLNVLYLCHQNLLNDPVLYLSKYINIYKERYYDLLLAVSERNDWKNWFLFMLSAVEATAIHTLEKVIAIEKLFDYTRSVIEERLPRIYKYELLEILFSQVYCKIESLVERNIGNRNTASDYLNNLTDLGILEKEKVGTEFIFKNIALYDLFGSD